MGWTKRAGGGESGATVRFSPPNPQGLTTVNAHLKSALAVLAVFAVTAFVQKKVFAVPVIGAYLPGSDAPKA